MGRLALTVTALSLLGACAHTQITANDPRARIYVNGTYLGRGDVEYDDRTGLPETMQVMVKTDYAKVKKEVRREFTLTTVLVGVMTYATGFLWAWQYPETIVVMLPPRPADGQEMASSWDEGVSAWDLPPGGWGQGPGAPTPAPPPIEAPPSGGWDQSDSAVPPATEASAPSVAPADSLTD